MAQDPFKRAADVDAITPAVTLYDPRYPHNVGAAVRACSCFGVKQVWVGQRLPREERMSNGSSTPSLVSCCDLLGFERATARPKFQEVAMRSMSHGTGLLLYVDGELYRGEASISFYYGTGSGDGHPVSIQFAKEVLPDAEVTLVSLSKGKLRRLEFVEKPEPQWNVIVRPNDHFEWR